MEASSVVERWASDSLGGLAIGALLPLSVSAVREARESWAADDMVALRDMWTHRLLDIGWNVGLSLDSASTHSKLLVWSGGDTALIVTAQALAWTAAAAARLLGPLPGWSSVTERHPRVVWALGRLGMLVDHALLLRCNSLVSWGRLHATCWCLAPFRSGFAAQSICWQATVGASVGQVRAAKMKKATGNFAQKSQTGLADNVIINSKTYLATHAPLPALAHESKGAPSERAAPPLLPLGLHESQLSSSHTRSA